MNVLALRPTSAAIASFDTGARQGSEDRRPLVEAEQVRSESDRRKRQDRRTEDQVRRRIAYGLEELVWDGTPVPQPARIVAAARLFSEGNTYFSGLLVDRSA
ncbi:MAG: hypothetical protein AAGG56_05165 [Pseudomonadota bacterium]